MKSLPFLFTFFSIFFFVSGQIQKLTSSDGVSHDEFGKRVSMYGNNIIVSSPLSVVNSKAYQGSAYMFTKSGKTWVQTQKLTSSDGAANDQFSYDVAIYENYVVSSCPFCKIGNNSYQGAVYVFKFDGTSWVQQQKLSAQDGSSGDQFGWSVSIYGNFTVVGAPFTTITGNVYQGSAYVFYFDGDYWVQMGKLIANDGNEGSLFGWSVAIYANYIIVGASYADISINQNQGAAYVFYFNGNSWNQTQKLLAQDGAAYDNFGWDISIYKGFAILGSPFDSTLTMLSRGSAYIFYLVGNSWFQQQKLIATDASSNAEFGWSVSIYGNFSVIGADGAQIGNNQNQGEAYLFYNNGKIWNQIQKFIVADGQKNTQLGTSVSIFGNYSLIGAPHEDISSKVDQGSAYVYDNNSKL